MVAGNGRGGPEEEVVGRSWIWCRCTKNVLGAIRGYISIREVLAEVDEGQKQGEERR